jgi:hypothetical protein
MATNTGTGNKSLTSKRSIMVRMTLPRQLMGFNLLNSFSASRVAKSVNCSKAVIFMLRTESSSAYNNCLACSLSEYARGPQEHKLLTIDSKRAKQSSRDSPGF